MMHTQLVGILNLTPDSFSDGGRFDAGVEAVQAAAEAMAAQAHVIDVGAESTRPGAVPLDAAEEWARLAPFFRHVLPGLHERGVIVSVDTRHAETARRALDHGAGWINDVGGFADDAMIAAVREAECRLVVMHSLTVPTDPRVTLPEGADAAQTLIAFARERAGRLADAGIARGRLIFDPGIGFGKTAAQSWDILRRVRELRAAGMPLLVGHSRKSFLARFTDVPPAERGDATLCVSAFLMQAGVEYLRVHDVYRHAQLAHILGALHG